MKRIFFIEDDLSLINGLSFAMKKQGYEIEIARTSLEAENMIWLYWMCHFQMAPAMICAEKSVRPQKCQSCS